MSSKYFIGMVLLLALFGCTTYQSKPLDPTHTEADFEARTLNDPKLKEFMQQNLKQKISPWPPISWNLEKLTLTAFFYHPDLEVARTELALAKAGVITAGGRPNPNVGTLFQYDANSAVGISPWSLGFNFDIPIETAHKRDYRIARAGALSEAARLNVVNAAWQVRSHVRRSLIDLYTAQQREALLNKQFEVQEALARMLEQRFSQGMIALPVATDARIARDRTRLDLDDAKKQEAESYGEIAESLGLPARALAGISFSFDFIDQFPGKLPEDEVRREALKSRSDILASLAEYAASQSALQQEIAKQYPDFHIGPGYLWDQGENKWFIGFSLALPTFNRNQGPIAEAEARRQQSEARFIALQARIISEIDRTLAGYRAAQKKLETTKDILNAELTRQEVLKRRLRPGEAARFSLVNAAVAVISAELLQLNALVNAQQALGMLEDALQRPLAQTDAVQFTQETPPICEQEK
jgi:cobalt-zinc-cadmium efflux system outer membrane protein